MIHPVILSGGSGTRLWPLSRTTRPKQLLPLADGDTRSMLQLTALRLDGWGEAAMPTIVAGAAQAGEIRGQLDEIGLGGASLVLEPAPRNTAAAIALAALLADPESLLLVMPSDHMITAPEPFRRAVSDASAIAAEGWLVTFGIAPSHPATGYGYIRQGDTLASNAFAVSAFVEKPDAATAERYLASGDFFWNAGIFLFRARDMIAALGTHAPDILDAVSAAVGDQRGRGGSTLADPNRFETVRAISIDYAVMERAERVAVVPVDMGWSDVGSWDALAGISEKDSDGNVVRGDVVLLEGRDCTVYTTGPTVTAVGVSDLVVVATGDAVLIVPRGRSQSVADLVAELRSRDRTDLL